MKRAITVIPIVLLTFVVSCTDTSEQAARRKQPPLLKKEQIDDFINAKLNRDRSAMEARIALDRASLALGSTDKADHLYRAVYWFKLSQAYGRRLSTKEKTQFAGVSKRLTTLVQEKYFNACRRDQKHTASAAIFQQLLDMLPHMEPNVEKNELRENIEAHIAHIKRLAATDK